VLTDLHNRRLGRHDVVKLVKFICEHFIEFEEDIGFTTAVSNSFFVSSDVETEMDFFKPSDLFDPQNALLAYLFVI